MKTMWKTSLGAALLGTLAGLCYARSRHTDALEADVNPTLDARAAVPAPVPLAKSERPANELPGVHLLKFPTRFAGGSEDDNDSIPTGVNEELEALFEQSEPDLQYAERVRARALEVLSVDPEAQVEDVDCTPDFCRILARKPASSELDWEAVDQALGTVMLGEKVFRATSDGETSTAYVYFSQVDTRLPITTTHQNDDDDDA